MCRAEKKIKIKVLKTAHGKAGTYPRSTGMGCLDGGEAFIVDVPKSSKRVIYVC
jgi:hypothetical protein